MKNSAPQEWPRSWQTKLPRWSGSSTNGPNGRPAGGAASITDIRVHGGSAEGFLLWFRGRMAADDRAVMINAHPEHYAISREPDGRVSVLETICGWTLPALIYVRFSQDEREAVAPLDPALPVRLVGDVLSKDGALRGRVLHQFGDTPDGFRGRLGIYWPAEAEPDMIKGHRWHLACEFVNWTRAYVESLSERGGSPAQ
jgi:hypothetical protein